MDYRTLYVKTKTLSVLLVEDYEPLRREMVEVLEDLFQTVSVASDGKEAFDVYQKSCENNLEAIDIVITDIQMPNMNGVVLSRKIRDMNVNQSLIVLSAHTDSTYLIELINMGISKFLTKPIMQDELFEILYKESNKIHIRNKNVEETLTVDIGGNYIWDKSAYVLKHKGRVIDLTKHELHLMQFFIIKQEHICTNQHIIDYFYGEDIDISEKNIRNLVFKLRKKIPESCILNVYGLGYKFTLT